MMPDIRFNKLMYQFIKKQKKKREKHAFFYFLMEKHAINDW